MFWLGISPKDIKSGYKHLYLERTDRALSITVNSGNNVYSKSGRKTNDFRWQQSVKSY